jgi:hypothetical protein
MPGSLKGARHNHLVKCVGEAPTLLPTDVSRKYNQMRCVYLVIWLLAVIEAKKYRFLLETEGWTIAGYGSVEHRPWSIYSSADGVSLSQFIIGKEERVNVDARNRDDKDLWYFMSPPIVLEFRPTLLMFTMISCIPSVRLGKVLY